MADMIKDEQGTAFPEKRKADLPNSVDKTVEQVQEEDNLDSCKRQKIEITGENEFEVAEEVAELKDGKEDNVEADGTDDKAEEDLEEPEVVDKEEEIPVAEVGKGKAILIEVSSSEYEESADDDSSSSDEDDEDSSDDSDTDFSDGLDSDSEECPLEESPPFFLK